MNHRFYILLTFVTALSGCTHRQLTRSAVRTTGTVMDIEYRTVMMNMAMLACQPEALPCYVRMKDGVVQVNDEIGFGNSGGLTTFNGVSFGIDQFGPSGARQVTEQWGTDAVTDPRDVKTLQDLHRIALGLPPLPDPEAITLLKRGRPTDAEKGGGKDGSGGGSSGAPSTASTGGGSSLSSGGGESGGDGNPQIPLDVLIRDLPPPGWFQVGRRKDVPKNACYVGRHGDRFAWVTPDGMPGLSRFTLTLLSVLKFKPGDVRTSSGLAVTR